MTVGATDGAVRPAVMEDRSTLLALMGDFYAETGSPFDAVQAATAFTTLLGDGELGVVWLAYAGGEPAGYVVLTLGFSMEYGGRDAFIDDLYVCPDHRGRGLGSRALDGAVEECGRRGVRALHLEVDRGNPRARDLYRQKGFGENDRQLMTLRLPSPNRS